VFGELFFGFTIIVHSTISRGGGGAAIEPDLRAGTAGRNWIKLCAAIVYIGWMRV